MPDSRPLPTTDRVGGFDHPPASLETSTPRTRRDRLGRALQGTTDLARDVVHFIDPSRDPRRRLLEPRDSRRRQRSSSLEDMPEPQQPPGQRRRRSKRQKLDDGAPRLTRRQPIKYGHYGQVEPGSLQLELVSCDGGVHLDPRNPSAYLGAENVLRHDKSVYCSDRNIASITIRHADDSAFCLEKLHIIGPEHGFTAPVRQGIVYIAMELSDLQPYQSKPPHARRADVYAPPYRRRNYVSLPTSPDHLTIGDALRDPEVDAAFDRREADYARGADEAHDLASADDQAYYGEDIYFGRMDAEAHCDIPVLPTPTAPDNAPNDTAAPVTMLSDSDVGPEDSSSQEVLEFRLRRARDMARRQMHEGWDSEARWSGVGAMHFDAANNRLARASEARDGNSLTRLDALMARNRLYSPPPPQHTRSPTPPMPRPALRQPMESARSVFASMAAGVDATRDERVRSAQFQIAKGKHQVALQFSPAVSGRFMLLKLWAGGGRGNVDVQSVVAKGYAGPRYFPSRELR